MDFKRILLIIVLQLFLAACGAKKEGQTVDQSIEVEEQPVEDRPIEIIESVQYQSIDDQIKIESNGQVLEGFVLPEEKQVIDQAISKKELIEIEDEDLGKGKAKKSNQVNNDLEIEVTNTQENTPIESQNVEEVVLDEKTVESQIDTTSDEIEWRMSSDKKENEPLKIDLKNYIEDKILRQSIENKFVHKKTFSEEKLALFLQQLLTRKQEIEVFHKTQYSLSEVWNPEYVEELIQRKDILQGYDWLISKVKELDINSPETDILLQQLIQIHHLDNALLNSPEGLGNLIISNYNKKEIEKVKINKEVKASKEATNLVIKHQDKKMTEEGIKSYIDNGGPISDLNPISPSPFLSESDLYSGVEIIFPILDDILVLDSFDKSKTLPTFNVFTKNGSDIKLYKLKIGQQMHSEPTANELLSLLGYPTKKIKYYTDLKINIGKQDIYKFKQSYARYFKSDVSKTIKNVDVVDGDTIITFYESTLTYEPDEFITFGSWNFEQQGFINLREARGLLLFNIWIMNPLLNDTDNNAVVLNIKDNNQKPYYIQDDMRLAFNKVQFDQLDYFPWNVVLKSDDKKLELGYSTYAFNSFLEKTTYSDAQWMIKKLAELTRSQIEKAVAVGNWHPSMGKQLVEKLIKRRNDLVKAFDLKEYEVVQDKSFKIENKSMATSENGVKLLENANENISTEDGLFVDGKQVGNLPFSRGGLELEFEFRFREHSILDTIRGVFEREVVENPNPTSDSDLFLVKDSFSVSVPITPIKEKLTPAELEERGWTDEDGNLLEWRPTLPEVEVAGHLTYSRRYTLITPASSVDEARLRNKFVFNVKLPFQILKKNLPKNYILVNESFIEGGGEIRIGNSIIPIGAFNAPVPLEVRAGVSRVFLTRSIINRKFDDKYVFYQDKSVYNEISFRLNAALSIIRIPIFKFARRDGEISREAFVLDESNPMMGNIDEILDQAIRYNNLKEVKTLGSPQKLEGEFVEKFGQFLFFGLINNQSLFRYENIKISNKSDNGEVEELYRAQVKSVKKLSGFLSRIENGVMKVGLISDLVGAGTEKEILKPRIELNFAHKQEKTNNEQIKDRMVTFINTVANDDNFIQFTPEIHSTNKKGKWTDVNMYTNILIYDKAIEKLMAINEQAFWANLATILKIEPRKLTHFRQLIDEESSQSGKGHMTTVPLHLRQIIIKSNYFLRDLRVARNSNKSDRTLRFLVKALKDIVWKNKGGFSPEILGALTKGLSENEMYMNGMITMSESEKLNSFARKEFYNQKGSLQRDSRKEFEFSLYDIASLYNMFP